MAEMSQPYDTVMKILLADEAGGDLIAWLAQLIGLPSNLVAKPIEVELREIQMLADKVYAIGNPVRGAAGARQLWQKGSCQS